MTAPVLAEGTNLDEESSGDDAFEGGPFGGGAAGTAGVAVGGTATCCACCLALLKMCKPEWFARWGLTISQA